jgi:NDP-sugar pyrophosphorylase family protein
VLEHTLHWLRDHGIRRVAVNLHHRPESVSAHLGDGSRFGVEIQYSVESELLGTAGGVKRLESFFDDPFLVVYGDVLTDLDLGALVACHLAAGTVAHATLALDRRPDASQGGVVELDADHRIRRFIEKPRPGEIQSPWVNSGVMMLDRALLARIPAGRFSDFGREVLPQWLSEGIPLHGWPLPAGTFLADIGTPESYERAEREWPPPGAARSGVAALPSVREA